jgi:NADH dehydrogenase
MDRKLDSERHRRQVKSEQTPRRSATPTRICILGGGFGGLYTALYLHRLRRLKSENCQITLVEQKDHFLFTPLLYELVTGELQTWEIAPSFEKLLGPTNIQFCQEIIEGVDLETHQVKLQSGTQLAYDYLVLAVGGQTHLNGIPGASAYAIPFRTLADTQRLKEQLRFLEGSDRTRIRVAIVGGGPNGVELAGKIADRLGERGEVRLIDRGKEILKTFSPSSRAAAHRALKARRVQIDLETSIEAIEPDQITLVQENQITNFPVDLVLWTAGTRSIEWVRNLACRHNDQGQLLSLPTLQLVDYPEVFALGDLAEIKDARGKPVPATAQAAFQQAACAAWNLKAALTGRPLRRFRYLHLGEMLTLGTNAAAVSSFGISLEGFLACLTRRLVYLQRLPTLRHRLQVLWHWLTSSVLKGLASLRKQPARLVRLVLKGLTTRGRRRGANSQRRKSRGGFSHK